MGDLSVARKIHELAKSLMQSSALSGKLPHMWVFQHLHRFGVLEHTLVLELPTQVLRSTLLNLAITDADEALPRRALPAFRYHGLYGVLHRPPLHGGQGARAGRGPGHGQLTGVEDLVLRHRLRLRQEVLHGDGNPGPLCERDQRHGGEGRGALQELPHGARLLAEELPGLARSGNLPLEGVQQLRALLYPRSGTERVVPVEYDQGLELLRAGRRALHDSLRTVGALALQPRGSLGLYLHPTAPGPPAPAADRLVTQVVPPPLLFHDHAVQLQSATGGVRPVAAHRDAAGIDGPHHLPVDPLVSGSRGCGGGAP
mmetsp:Transcript_48504/g.149848  ORF Transcript_48504/g.149848 Transcript_48504/m.149848 type:complete len:314 (-) Transcript_48504:305-1246(-)